LIRRRRQLEPNLSRIKPGGINADEELPLRRDGSGHISATHPVCRALSRSKIYGGTVSSPAFLTTSTDRHRIALLYIVSQKKLNQMFFSPQL